MATVISPPEQRVLLRDISWEMYEGLLTANVNNSAPRFAYDQGLLEIMSPSLEHEGTTGYLSQIIMQWSDELEMEIFESRSTTFKREDLGKGFEPDASFYIQSINAIIGKKEIDLNIDPPPDLVVEVDITNSSINKLKLFAALKVPEVWRYGRKLIMYKLESGVYIEVNESPSLSGLNIATVMEFVNQAEPGKLRQWGKRIRERARAFKQA